MMSLVWSCLDLGEDRKFYRGDQYLFVLIDGDPKVQ